jgi:BirA family biotin operon repressor/biotin-[acetyl-CoA-carboxylase] ligase
MDLVQSGADVERRGGRFEYLAEAPSTNDELVRRATGPDAASWPDASVVVTDNQTSGRGRLGRVWVAPAGKCLAISVLLRPGEPAPPIETLAWVPLIAGLAMTRAVASVVPQAALKWPNDVLIRGRKVCGILSELLPGLDGVVVGAGLNLTLGAEELPTETSTSLRLEAAPGTEIDADAMLAVYLRELTALYRSHIAADGDPVSSGLLAAVTERCETIGRSVKVELPSGERLLGEAVAIDVEGRIVVKSNTALTAVAAGDVTHLRY